MLLKSFWFISVFLLLSSACGQKTTHENHHQSDSTVKENPKKGFVNDTVSKNGPRTSKKKSQKHHKKAASKDTAKKTPEQLAKMKQDSLYWAKYVPPGVDTTGPWTEYVGNKVISHNMDLWYVKSPQMRKNDSIRVFTQYREKLLNELGREKVRQVDSTIWEVWQRKLRHKHRYHKYQPFVYKEKK